MKVFLEAEFVERVIEGIGNIRSEISRFVLNQADIYRFEYCNS